MKLGVKLKEGINLFKKQRPSKTKKRHSESIRAIVYMLMYYFRYMIIKI